MNGLLLSGKYLYPLADVLFFLRRGFPDDSPERHLRKKLPALRHVKKLFYRGVDDRIIVLDIGSDTGNSLFSA